MAGPGDHQAAVAAGRGHLRVSHADREQMIDVLKVAFVQGRLTKDEFDARVGQTFIARTYAELAPVTDDIPARRPGAQPPRTPPRRALSNAARWGASGLVTPVILAAAFGIASVPGDGGFGAVTALIAFVYFMSWLSVGADLLWQWHSMSVPAAGMCVRCAHTADSHQAPLSCAARTASLTLSSRCPCAGYVPPGISPQALDLCLLRAP
ncbi:MAG: DUF1707 domain-containing protein [Actinomycetota bacterium]|nr:DUF1707 domain-containing protein [Actinomycetota bacterium]